MKDIAIFGAGGFGREIACLIRIINEKKTTWNLIGFFDDGITKGASNEYGVILGNTKDLNDWTNELALVIAIGSPTIIKKIAERIVNPLIFYPNLVAPDVIYLDESRISMGKGNIICSRCLFSCNITIGDFNIFNGFIPVGHDVIVGNYNVVMPSVNISGEVSIGDCNFMGVASVILQRLKIGNHVRVGAGSVVMRKTIDNTLYIGNPAVKMKI